MILKSPIEVFWCLTGRCNLKCVFCLADAGPYSAKEELGRNAHEFIVDELIRNKVLKVYLTGGEPLLSPEITHYISKLRKHDIFVELTTNGLLLDNELIKELSKAKLQKVQVSINGSSPQTNDLLMGLSYEKIINSLQKLVSNGINTHVKVTIIRQNIADMLNLVDLLYRLGIKDVELCEVLALGRGFTNLEELKPNEQDLINLRDEITKVNQVNDMRISFQSISLTIKENGRASICTLGHRSSSSCLIMQDGNVIPCFSSHIWEIKNNIMDKGLKQCWNDLANYKQFLDPNKLKGKCENCQLKQECQGGCRAAAYLFTNDLWEVDPFCPYPGMPDKTTKRDAALPVQAACNQ